MKNINVPFVSNDLLNIKVEKYCAILGSNPSKGARSPLLWNKCFETMNLPYYFFPFDVEKSRLGKLIDYLRSDDSFLGGAVAAIHKEIIIDFIDEVEEEAKIIGAVNLIYRKKNKLIGANTDGLGGISSLANHMNLDLDNFASGKIATVVGTGGAAKAIAVYLSKAIGKSGKIFIAGRSR